jgi:hypothetical protein
VNHEQIRSDTTAELTRIIQLALSQWHREGGKSAGPEGPVIAFGKRVMRGGVMMVVGHSIRGHEWATPAYYVDATRSLRKDKRAKCTPATARSSGKPSPASCSPALWG